MIRKILMFALVLAMVPVGAGAVVTRYVNPTCASSGDGTNPCCNSTGACSGTNGAYQTFFAWEAAEDGTATDDHAAYVWTSGSGVENGSVEITGWGNTAFKIDLGICTSAVHATCDGDDVHGGVWDETKFHLVGNDASAIRIGENNVSVRGLQMRSNCTDNSPTWGVLTYIGDTYYDADHTLSVIGNNIIVLDSNDVGCTGPYAYGLRNVSSEMDGPLSVAHGNLVYEDGTDNILYQAFTFNGDAFFNTVHEYNDTYTVDSFTCDATSDVYGNVVYNEGAGSCFTAVCDDGDGSSGDYNACNAADADMPGAGSITYTPANEFADMSSLDYRLDDGSSALVDSASSGHAYGDPSGSGVDRGATWDMGFDEYLSESERRFFLVFKW